MTKKLVSAAQIAKHETHDREFNMTAKHFATISKVVYEHAGIVLSAVKEDMVYSRVSRRIRRTASAGFDDYLNQALNPNSEEFTHFVNAITTNLTSFYREKHHFDFLEHNLLPALKADPRRNRLRIWSAGCSTGEEPYTIAMTLRDRIPKAWDSKILATDLDTNVVTTGRNAIYGLERVDGLEKSLITKNFENLQVDGHPRVQVKKELRDLCYFKQLNLLREWPMKGPFDFIFCRNVVIYFDKPTQKVLFDRFAQMLAPGGYLFIGHSESMYKLTDRFESLGNTIYRKIK